MLQKKYDMNNDRIIDIHCHSSAKPFLSDNPGEPRDKKILKKLFFNENQIIAQILEIISKIKNSTQSNLDNLYQGGVRIAFVSITPIEKGFLKKTNWQLNNPKLGEYTNEKLISILTGFSESSLLRIQSDAYDDYFNHFFLPEFEWLINNENNQPDDESYIVRFPKNINELETNLLNDKILNIIINVEGAHSFAMAPKNEIINQMYLYNEDELNKIKSNINKMKTAYDVPVFSVGLMHHFWNGLGGHSESFLAKIKKFKDQSIGLNEPLNDAGKQIINELVKPVGARKGFILDIKHMSPKARADYYQMRKENQAFYEDKPILCSHTGIASYFDTLDEWIQNNEKEIKGKCYLHEKAINLCCEDVVQIYESKGLIGIQLDEKRLFGKHAIKEINREIIDDEIVITPNFTSYKASKYFWANIFSAINDLAVHYGRVSPRYWDIFCIGSDFDGLINHLYNCQEAASLSDFKESLYAFLENPDKIHLPKFYSDSNCLTIPRINELKCDLTNKEIINKLFYMNAYNFLKSNF